MGIAPVVVLVIVLVAIVIGATLVKGRPETVIVQPVDEDVEVDGDVEQVLILWDGLAPTIEETARLAQQAVPGRMASDLHIEQVRRPALSWALAAWHVQQDEASGALSPGASRRTQPTLLNAKNGHRLVTVVRTGPAPTPTSPRNEWAHEVVLRHLARGELEIRPDLMWLPGWRRMSTPEVLDFVLDADAAPADGQITGVYRAFGDDLDMIVSVVPVTAHERIKDLLPGGYFAQLERLLTEADARKDEADIAHWILCRDTKTEVHLSYLPADHSQALMPWDLLSAEERRSGRKIG